jgi:hypothetical protein
LGGAWPGCPSPDGSDSYLYPGSDDAYTSTFTNFDTTTSEIAHTNPYAHLWAIRHTPTIADTPRADGGATDTYQYAHPGAGGYVPAVANFGPAN